MEKYQIVLCGFLIPVLVLGVLAVLNNHKSPAGKIVCMPKGFCIVGYGCAVLAVGVIIISLFRAVHVLIWVFTIACAVISLVCLLIYYSMYIIYDKKHFYAKSFFRTKEYSYSDIQSIVPKVGSGYTLRMTNGRVHVDSVAVGGLEFLHYSNRIYNKSGNGLINVYRGGLFHGYILEPWPMVIVMVLFGAIFLGLAVFGTIVNLTRDYPPEDLIETFVVFSGYEQVDHKVIFYSEQGNLNVPFDAVSNWDKLQEEIHIGKTFHVLYKQLSEEFEMQAWQLESDGNTYVSLEDAVNASRSFDLRILFIFWGVAVLIWLFILTSFYILDHAPKYPLLVRLLVKRDYINF